METQHYLDMGTPLGELLLSADARGLKEIIFQSAPSPRRAPAGKRGGAITERARDQIAAYLAGELEEFDLPLSAGGTEFQRRVWTALRGIPYGETVSYRELARRIGKPKASRAVGAANGRNPLPIVVPCHRVIGSDGRLTGYAGGLHVKQHLLELEQRRR